VQGKHLGLRLVDVLSTEQLIDQSTIAEGIGGRVLLATAEVYSQLVEVNRGY
jgi:hypothetical protein